jgi:hypothetical protein
MRLVSLLLNNEGADDVVGVTGEEGGTVRRPAQGDALDGDGLGVLLLLGEVGLQVRDDELLGFQIPDLDGRGGGCAQPVAGRREAQGVDDVTSLEGRQVAALVEVPEHGLAVLATGSAQRTIRGHGNGVNVAGVADQVVAQTAERQRPDLDELVPTARDDQGLLSGGRETHARNPLGVTLVGGEGQLELTQGVPQVDLLVTGTRDDVTVVGGESDGEDVTGVADEAAGGGAGVQVPQAQSTIPRGGQGELAIEGDGNVLNDVGVTFETADGLAERVGSVVTLELPDDDGLVAGSGDDHVRGLQGGGDGGNPATVTLELAFENRNFSH